MDQEREQPVSGGVLRPDEEAAIRDAVADALSRSVPEIAPHLDQKSTEFLRLIAATATAAEACTELLNQAVTGARRAGLSWEAIGGVLGVTRQAAQQRFGASSPAPEGQPERRVLRGVHALNEEAVLDAEGLQGYHLVDFGPLYLVLERSTHPWRHLRVTFATRSLRARLRSEGWEEVGRWFPYTYFKRPSP